MTRTLRAQLLISHMLLVVIMAVVFALGVGQLIRIRQGIEVQTLQNFRTVSSAQDLRVAVREFRLSLTELNQGDLSAARIDFAAANIVWRSAMNEIIASAPEEKENIAILLLDFEQFYDLTSKVLSKNEFLPEPGVGRVIESNLKPKLRALDGQVANILSANREDVLASVDDTQQELDQALNRGVLAIVIALLVAFLLARSMIRRAITPLALLAKQAENIEQGNYDAASLGRKDEIGRLSDTFDSMAAKLAEVRQSESRRLQRAERMSDAALESLYDPVIVTDGKGRIIHLNPAAAGLFGPAPISPRKHVADHIADKRVRKAIERAISRGQVSDSEDENSLIHVKQADSERTYRLRATPMKGDEDQLLGSVTVLEDVTHLKVLDSLKTEFIGVASHELRTPVTSLLLSNELLMEGAVGELTDIQREVLSAQKNDLQRLDKLLRELLDLSRLEGGKTPPRFEIISIAELARSPFDGMLSQAKQKDVELIFLTETEAEDKVRADRSQIGRVVTNLVANAIRHTPPGGKVTVRTFKTEDSFGIEVADTGEGIPADYLKRVFERFVQVPGATGGGAGLGLAIASAIVTAHSGTMSVDSVVEKGSQFRLTLPNVAISGETA